MVLNGFFDVQNFHVMEAFANFEKSFLQENNNVIMNEYDNFHSLNNIM